METTRPTTDQRSIYRHAFLRLLGTGVGAALLTGCASACAGATSPDPSAAVPNYLGPATINHRGYSSLRLPKPSFTLHTVDQNLTLNTYDIGL